MTARLPYKTALKKIADAARDTPSFDGIMAIAKATIQTVYLDMKKITPDCTYKLNYAVTWLQIDSTINLLELS